MSDAKTSQYYIIPTMRYHDAESAIRWLCECFGFERHLLVEGPSGTIAHAQLILGDAMIMVGSASDDDFGLHQIPPSSSDAPVTQSAYVVIDDVKRHYERAVEGGATIVIELRAEDHGGLFYCCRDPQGQLWNFGDYNPWQTA